MRPILGIAAELFALFGLAWAGLYATNGLVYFVYVLVAELLSTYVIHCPAHYLVGSALGIRFLGIKGGRSTLARALPPRLSRIARLLPVVTLTTDKRSLASAGKQRAAAMYASGTVASALAAFVVAALAAPRASLALVVASWAVAFGYLAFDVVFSPRGGDIMRARAALSSSA